jgi:hypothetical protein
MSENAFQRAICYPKLLLSNLMKATSTTVVSPEFLGRACQNEVDDEGGRSGKRASLAIASALIIPLGFQFNKSKNYPQIQNRDS